MTVCSDPNHSVHCSRFLILDKPLLPTLPNNVVLRKSNCPKSLAASLGDKELVSKNLTRSLTTLSNLDGLGFTIKHFALCSVCMSKTTPSACHTDLGSCSFSLSKAKPKSFIIIVLKAQKAESMLSWGSIIQKSSKKWSVTM